MSQNGDSHLKNLLKTPTPGCAKSEKYELCKKVVQEEHLH